MPYVMIVLGRCQMKTISRFTEHYLDKTKVRKGDFDWDLYNMKEELTDEQEALRQTVLMLLVHQ